LIKPRRIAAFVGSVDVFAVPVGDHDLAVGVEAGDDDGDNVIEYALGFLVLAGKLVVNQFGAIWAPPISVACMLMDWTTNGLASAASLRISASGMPRESLSFELISFKRLSLAIFAGEVIMAIRNGLPSEVGHHVDDFHTPATLLLHQVEIFDDLVPASHLPIGAELETEEFIRGVIVWAAAVARRAVVRSPTTRRSLGRGMSVD